MASDGHDVEEKHAELAVENHAPVKDEFGTAHIAAERGKAATDQ